MSSRVTSTQVTNLIASVNGRLEELNKPLRLTAQIWNTPTLVKIMSDGGAHYFSQTMTLRESYEALSLLSHTLENMNGKE